MKKIIYFLGILCIFLFANSYSQASAASGQENQSDPRHEVLELSKKKWMWIKDRQIDSLTVLFDEEIVSRQGSIRMDKPGHIDVIKNGNIFYQEIKTLNTDIQIVDDLSTLLTTVEFHYASEGRESEIKYVTEMFQKDKDGWKLILLQIDPV